MGWATRYAAALKCGETVRFRPRGHSMTGRVNDGQLVTVEPLPNGGANVGDVVLCRVDGREYLHLVKARDGGEYLIGNNKGKVNGWTRHVFGVVTKIEP